MSGRRVAADGPLGLLLLLAGGFLLSLGAFVARHTLPYDPFETCQTMAATVVARLSTLGMLLPLGVIAVVLVAGALALGHQALATRRVLARVLARRALPDARLGALAARAGLDGRLDVVPDDTVFTFCYGLLRPRVCLSAGLAGMLDDDELLAVLRHEAHHARHHDPLKILVVRSLASALFFLPLAGALRNGYLAGKEICADEDATAGGEIPLARALWKMLAAPRPAWPAGVLAVGALSPTEARLRHLLEQGRPGMLLPSPTDWILSAALVAGLFGFSYGSAAAREAEPMDAACSTSVLSLYAPPPALAVPPPSASRPSLEN